MRKPLIILLLLSFVITAKAQQTNKPADATSTAQTQATPEPPGGATAFAWYMKKYTNHQYNSADTGRVTASFSVETDGSLSDYKIVHSLNTEADNITLQVLKGYDKKWKPAMQNGQAVKAQYTVVVPFGR